MVPISQEQGPQQCQLTFSMRQWFLIAVCDWRWVPTWAWWRTSPCSEFKCLTCREEARTDHHQASTGPRPACQGERKVLRVWEGICKLSPFILHARKCSDKQTSQGLSLEGHRRLVFAVCPPPGGTSTRTMWPAVPRGQSWVFPCFLWTLLGPSPCSLLLRNGANS